MNKYIDEFFINNFGGKSTLAAIFFFLISIMSILIHYREPLKVLFVHIIQKLKKNKKSEEEKTIDNIGTLTKEIVDLVETHLISMCDQIKMNAESFHTRLDNIESNFLKLRSDFNDNIDKFRKESISRCGKHLSYLQNHIKDLSLLSNQIIEIRTDIEKIMANSESLTVSSISSKDNMNLILTKLDKFNDVLLHISSDLQYIFSNKKVNIFNDSI